MENKLLDFVKEMSSVVCYGAGEYAFFITLFLEAHRIGIDYYVVSDGQHIGEEYLNKKIYSFSEAIQENMINKNVVVAIGGEAQLNIQTALEEKRIKGYFLTKEDIDNIFIFLFNIPQEKLKIILNQYLLNKNDIMSSVLKKSSRSMKFLYDLIQPTSDYEHEYLLLSEEYKMIPRYFEKRIPFQNTEIRVPDVASFLCAYESILVQKIYNFIPQKKDDIVILDFGSNIGLSLFFFSKKYPKATILGFEPDNRIFDVLKYNLKALQCQNVHVFKQAVWYKDEILSFYSEGADAGRIEAAGDNAADFIQIQAIDSLVVMNEYAHIDFLKIDIEGAETVVLRHIAKKLKDVDNIFVEYHSAADEKQSLPEILKILSDAGFRIYFGEEGLIQKKPYVKINTYAGFDALVNIYGVRK
ncbi:methyltransferase, FkbM family [Propionispira arboris]|uniref:Methyltransferase, FkbM family n=1 Tax=Propionispira arboris TaxID=84035 RepID=A0A1H7CDS4_9FIRM|nr:FkbM family methyltransferase [Propionispira arboris]SEJ87841.1 methyltransferase, FkbM family [Propionispira arboris]